MFLCPVRTLQFLMYDGLDSEPSHQELFVDAKGAQHAKHKVSMLCDQDQGAIESHGAA